MKLNSLELSGCILIEGTVHHDARGTFVKTFHKKLYREHGLDINIAEQFYSISAKNVIRGMHFQNPPNDHVKIISCFSGKVLDVLLDIRKDSESYGQYITIELEANDGKIIYIPSGIAHGFLSLEQNSGMFYNTTTVYHPESDSGLHWDSFGYRWPTENPIISERDMGHLSFDVFQSSF